MSDAKALASRKTGVKTTHAPVGPQSHIANATDRRNAPIRLASLASMNGPRHPAQTLWILGNALNRRAMRTRAPLPFSSRDRQLSPGPSSARAPACARKSTGPAATTTVQSAGKSKSALEPKLSVLDLRRSVESRAPPRPIGRGGTAKSPQSSERLPPGTRAAKSMGAVPRPARLRRPTRQPQCRESRGRRGLKISGP